jgi:phosphoribosylanthranilate isomerase
MPTPKIKICGISTSAALDAALKARADYVGLVFFPKSPRNVAIEQAAALARQARAQAKVVALFVNPTADQLDAVRAAVPLDVIQLHGAESPAQLAQWRTRHGIEVWKAIGVRQRADLDEGRRYLGAADRVLFDAKPPEGADLPGGTGLRIDWGLFADYRPALPWGLAGGLDPRNVAEATRITGAPLVDVSSGVESAPGVKDASLIAAFCQAARGE